MKQSLFKRVCALLVVMIMVVASVPMTVFAAVTLPDDMRVISDTETTLAPGVTHNQVVLYNEDGQRVEMYVTTVDTGVETVGVYANYKDNQNEVLGMSKTTEQAAAAEANHEEPYTVVAAINASYYNMTTGKPTGAFVMEGNDITTESEGNAYPFFAVLKDGTYMIGAKGEYSSYKGQIAEAVGGWIHLVNDGAICAGLNTTQLYPRQTIGLTADGKVIIMTADGNQAPASVGLTVQEQAEVMLSLGCIEAIHLDGGGSTTHCIKAEGSDKLTVTNSPSDGSERSVSNSLIVVSTAVADGTFDHATLTAENEYVTPGSSVKVSAVGVDAAGGSAEIPADVSWQLADSAMGSVENGVFTSNGTEGDAVVQMVSGGKVVGEATVHVVVPDKLIFNSTQITVPYGKTVKLAMTATYGLNSVAMKDGDVNFTLSNDAVGSVSGYDFTACEENLEVTGSDITATLVFDENVTASAAIVLGKGSEILWDFEDRDISGLSITTGYPQYGPMGSAKDENGNYYYNGQNEVGSLEIVTSENGQVRNGEYALAAHCDFTQIYETGFHQLKLSGLNLQLDANAQRIGMWIYMPELEEMVGSYVRLVGTSKGSTSNDVTPDFWNVGFALTLEYEGWYYFSGDISGFGECTINTMQIYINDRDGVSYDYYFKDYASVNSKFTLYIDDITVDYSSAVDDRIAPTFGTVNLGYEGIADAVTMNGQVIDKNLVSVSVKVADDNAGLDLSTAKVYVDGVVTYANVSCTAAGVMSIENVELADGVHTFKFEICDKMGNKAYVERQVVIAANSDKPTVSVVPQSDVTGGLLIGSLYWVDLVASNVEKIDSVTTELNLNSVSSWELEHMEVAEGFSASYTVNEITNNATITITKTGTVSVTGEAVLVSLPIRTWVSRLTEYDGYEASTPEKLWSRKIIWPMDIKLGTKSGFVTFTDGTVGTFSMADLVVITELYGNYAELNENGDYANKTSWHQHTAVALEDKAATCTKDGYTDRTFCEECNSVVDWGTTIPATGHTYELTDGVLKCHCGELFNGVYTDGKTYVDGVIAEGWVNNNAYYVDGVALTGIQLIDGYYYDFGENGITNGKYNGLFELNGKLYYAVVGTCATGWIYEDGAYYYFSPNTNAAVDGRVNIDGYNYEFVNKQLYNGHWVHNADGSIEYVWAGTKLCSQWFTLRENTYYFDNNCKLATGTCLIKLSTGGDSQFFIFDENGVFIEAVTSTGCYEYNGATYFLKEGVVQTGLQEENGVYYYFRSNYQMYIGTYRYVDDNAANGLVSAGYCWFDAEDYHLLNNEFADPDGDGIENYYVMGRPNTSNQWVEIDGKTYYLDSKGAPVMGDTWIDGVYYYFDSEDGHLCDNEFIIRDNTMYYCIGGQIQYLGLIEIEGETYYISTNSGRVMRSCGYWVSGDKNPTGKDQLYYFDENGCRRDEEFFTIDGVLYYMIDGQPAKRGLFELDGSLYYASTNSGAIKTGKYYVETKNANGRIGNCYYYFGQDGKALNEVFYTDVDGSKYYMVDGLPSKAGLVLIDGDYYYLSTNSGAAKCGVTYYIEAKNTNGLLEAGQYTFDKDGKIVF